MFASQYLMTNVVITKTKAVLNWTYDLSFAIKKREKKLLVEQNQRLLVATSCVAIRI